MNGAAENRRKKHRNDDGNVDDEEQYGFNCFCRSVSNMICITVLLEMRFHSILSTHNANTTYNILCAEAKMKQKQKQKIQTHDGWMDGYTIHKCSMLSFKRQNKLNSN